jgi:hypothetical protein
VPMAASLVYAPSSISFYPLYLLSLVLLFRTISKIPLLMWTDSVLCTYFVWHLHGLGHPWRVPERP